jgi:hypothetical protein
MATLAEMVQEAGAQAGRRQKHAESLFQDLYIEIKNPVVAHMGVDAVQRGGAWMVQLRHHDVFSFREGDGALMIEPLGKAPEEFTELDPAKRRAAALISAAQREPRFAEDKLVMLEREKRDYVPVGSDHDDY